MEIVLTFTGIGVGMAFHRIAAAATRRAKIDAGLAGAGPRWCEATRQVGARFGQPPPWPRSGMATEACRCRRLSPTWGAGRPSHGTGAPCRKTLAPSGSPRQCRSRCYSGVGCPARRGGSRDSSLAGLQRPQSKPVAWRAATRSTNCPACVDFVEARPRSRSHRQDDVLETVCLSSRVGSDSEGVPMNVNYQQARNGNRRATAPRSCSGSRVVVD